MELPPIVLPLLSKLCLNFPAGTHVVVKTRGFGTFRGLVFQNPADTGIKNSITIINAINTGTGNAVPGHITFFQDDINSVTVTRAVQKRVATQYEPVMDTHLVSDLDQLRKFFDVLKREIEVGCYIRGTENRSCLKPTYVLLNLRHILVVIPVKNFEGNEQIFWEELGTALFANATITKIFWDSRGTRIFLNYYYNLPLTNVFDLRIMEKYLNSLVQIRQGDPLSEVNQVTDGSSFSLTDLLKKYLYTAVPSCDVELLLDFEEPDTSIRPSSVLAREKKYCAVKVKYLLILKSELQKRIFKPCKILTEKEGRHMMTA